MSLDTQVLARNNERLMRDIEDLKSQVELLPLQRPLTNSLCL
jgi:hypothetical protein